MRQRTGKRPVAAPPPPLLLRLPPPPPTPPPPLLPPSRLPASKRRKDRPEFSSATRCQAHRVGQSRVWPVVLIEFLQIQSFQESAKGKLEISASDSSVSEEKQAGLPRRFPFAPRRVKFLRRSLLTRVAVSSASSKCFLISNSISGFPDSEYSVFLKQVFLMEFPLSTFSLILSKRYTNDGTHSQGEHSVVGESLTEFRFLESPSTQRASFHEFSRTLSSGAFFVVWPW